VGYRRHCAHAAMKQSIQAIASLRTVNENALMGLENKKPINMMTEADERLRSGEESTISRQKLPRHTAPCFSNV
jgi:hypothetical protein